MIGSVCVEQEVRVWPGVICTLSSFHPWRRTSLFHGRAGDGEITDSNVFFSGGRAGDDKATDSLGGGVENDTVAVPNGCPSTGQAENDAFIDSDRSWTGSFDDN